MSAPTLIGSAGSTNLVVWGGRVWAVPQSMGPVHVDQEHHRLTSYDNEAAARAALEAISPTSVPAPSVYPLSQLDGRLEKVITVTTEEKDDRGMYVFRDDNGEPFMWGPTPQRYEFHRVATVAEADHVMFLCPLCFARNGGDVGTHGVMVTFAERNVPDEAGSRGSDGKPTRWAAIGTTIDDLVLTPSIALDASRPANEGCHWHGFVGSNGIPPGHAG